MRSQKSHNPNEYLCETTVGKKTVCLRVWNIIIFYIEYLIIFYIDFYIIIFYIEYLNETQ